MLGHSSLAALLERVGMRLQDWNSVIVALRVLGQINRRRDPDPSDVSELRSFADPADAHLPADALARAVINAKLASRRKARAAANGR